MDPLRPADASRQRALGLTIAFLGICICLALTNKALIRLADIESEAYHAQQVASEASDKADDLESTVSDLQAEIEQLRFELEAR
jgi:hypothetical protein